MRDVLFISKPVAPPWNDSNKNLVRDISRSVETYRARVMVPRGSPLEGTLSEPLYAQSGTYAPSRWANARVLARLFTGPRADIWHFFFAPNPLTLRAGRIAAKFRGVSTVHTIASAPDNLEQVAPMLFADRVVALSQHTATRLERVGIRALKIPPALAPLSVDRDTIESVRTRLNLPANYVLYPGDLEFGDGAMTFVTAAARAPEIGWVVASRPKTARAREARVVLEQKAKDIGANIVWLGETTEIHAIVAGARTVALVSNSLHAKMDWPLVLLEALALGVPVVVAENTAAAELTQSGAVSAISSGNAEQLVSSVKEWEARERSSRGTLLEKAARWVSDVCGPRSVARAHEELYDQLLAPKLASSDRSKRDE